jgi:hypothetical protein
MTMQNDPAAGEPRDAKTCPEYRLTTSAALDGAVDTAITTAAAPHPDVVAISRISAVPTILKVISENTGLRLALVARVTENEWTALATLDRMEFGLSAGDHLDVATTLCREVRSSREPIVIEHPSQEPEF